MPLPSWVINGTTVLPAKSQEERNVATGGAMVAHQQGEPTKITSYCERSPTGFFSAGRTPASISFLPWSTTARYSVG